eukprot:CAMPEP_0114238052 /NCGR_PEP_ID=MMETSP0058-20121206/7720_1 /TAXON_ID=36894 /ORGANISM="Pyramimonas parkeae, CCMP726" /LENGTH=193 /DNA_ID=CAMNT_0001350139 /DNA_START=132 /DNA_END=713 /DNA_ORIENTATION=+
MDGDARINRAPIPCLQGTDVDAGEALTHSTRAIVESSGTGHQPPDGAAPVGWDKHEATHNETGLPVVYYHQASTGKSEWCLCGDPALTCKVHVAAFNFDERGCSPTEQGVRTEDHRALAATCTNLIVAEAALRQDLLLLKEVLQEKEETIRKLQARMVILPNKFVVYQRQQSLIKPSKRCSLPPLPSLPRNLR